MAKKKAGRAAGSKQGQAGRKKSDTVQDEGRAEMGVSAEPAAPQGEQTDAGGGQTPKGRQKKTRPVRCIYRHADVELRRAFPAICNALIAKAKETGSVQHLQALEKLGVKAKAAKGQKQGPSLGELLMAELKRRQDEREQALDGVVPASEVLASEVAGSAVAAVEAAGSAVPETTERETTAKGATSGDAEER